MAEKNFEFNPKDEYLFYPEALSRQNSFETAFMNERKSEVKRNKALYDPNIRKQVAKLKPKRPYFLMTVTTLQIALLLWSCVLNYQKTGSFIQTKPSFNYLIGPSQGVCAVLLLFDLW